jgi:hypothetical protein
VNEPAAAAGSLRVQSEGEKPELSSEDVPLVKGCPSVPSEGVLVFPAMLRLISHVDRLHTLKLNDPLSNRGGRSHRP